MSGNKKYKNSKSGKIFNAQQFKGAYAVHQNGLVLDAKMIAVQNNNICEFCQLSYSNHRLMPNDGQIVCPGDYVVQREDNNIIYSVKKNIFEKYYIEVLEDKNAKVETIYSIKIDKENKNLKKCNYSFNEKMQLIMAANQIGGKAREAAEKVLIKELNNLV